jgi:polyisoprenoid-binding protein YceI
MSCQVAFAQDGYQVQPGTSKIGFSIRNFLSQTPGVFKAFQGTLNFSANRPENSSVTFEIEVASIDTGIAKRDDHLRTDDYFGAEAHPLMTFSSRSFRRVGTDRYAITGPVTIKGHTKTITVLAMLTRHASLWTVQQDSLLFETSFVIDRTEFGVGEASNLMGSKVKVDLNLDFRG